MSQSEPAYLPTPDAVYRVNNQMTVDNLVHCLEQLQKHLAESSTIYTDMGDRIVTSLESYEKNHNHVAFHHENYNPIISGSVCVSPLRLFEALTWLIGICGSKTTHSSGLVSRITRYSKVYCHIEGQKQRVGVCGVKADYIPGTSLRCVILETTLLSNPPSYPIT